MKIDFLGAGISGLATAWKLSDKHEVNIIEKTSKTGGMAASFTHGDFTFDGMTELLFEAELDKDI